MAVGTDSLASTPDLNVFARTGGDARACTGRSRRRSSSRAPRAGGACAGFDADYGTLEPGKRARMLGVRVPAAVSDVEEYLLSGIGPDQLLLGR